MNEAWVKCLAVTIIGSAVSTAFALARQLESDLKPWSLPGDWSQKSYGRASLSAKPICRTPTARQGCRVVQASDTVAR